MIKREYFFKIFLENGIIKKIFQETTKKEVYVLLLINSILLSLSLIFADFFNQSLTTYSAGFFIFSIVMCFFGIIIVEAVTGLFSTGTFKFDIGKNNFFKYLAVTNHYLFGALIVYNLISLALLFTASQFGIDLLFLFAILNYMNYKKLKEMNEGKDYLAPKIIYAIAVCIAYLGWLTGLLLLNFIIGGLNG